MAEDKPVTGKTGKGSRDKQSKEGAEEKPEYTTLRFFAEDGEDISDLADMEGKTIAQLYREVCAPLIRARRIAKMEDRLRKLKDKKG